MTLYIASNNEHKIEEMQPLLGFAELKSPRDAGLTFDFPENGDTFIANALGKARALYDLVGCPTLADDSGLCVDALGGKPGVFSARYGSAEGVPPLESSERNALLLEEMAGIKERACHFVCCMVLVLSTSRFVVIQETCEGILLESPRGTGGFGYDPIVFLPAIGKSVAELSVLEKDHISHRGRALTRLIPVLEGLETHP
ncbi:MAG: RdgB/HAM1 family non-canonical purine NTP pyrophosphatase [Spirochaetales bacterium]|nr:MAG: RdgB/HAM1 family non-canonical purine NTP pyrophosphatase [Spirochaetales bacterium]